MFQPTALSPFSKLKKFNQHPQLSSDSFGCKQKTNEWRLDTTEESGIRKDKIDESGDYYRTLDRTDLPKRPTRRNHGNHSRECWMRPSEYWVSSKRPRNCVEDHENIVFKNASEALENAIRQWIVGTTKYQLDSLNSVYAPLRIEHSENPEIDRLHEDVSPLWALMGKPHEEVLWSGSTKKLHEARWRSWSLSLILILLCCVRYFHLSTSIYSV